MRVSGLTRCAEDASLGPPATVFASSRQASKADGDNTNNDDAPKSRLPGHRSNNKSTNEKETRDSRDLWSGARERRANTADDDQKQERGHNRRERDHDGERRNGNEGRWGDRRQNGERQGGWRDRERDRRDRDWDRGARDEKVPEWMDDPPTGAAGDDLRTMGKPRNQEEFQRWKDAMSGKKSCAEPDATPKESSNPQSVAKEAAPVKAPLPPMAEGAKEKPFGDLGEGIVSSPAADGVHAPAKAAATKAKGSRFASMFKESQMKEAAAVEPSNCPAPSANGTAEDEAGFKRILQMLGGTGMNPSASAPMADVSSLPPPASGANGTSKPKSRFSGFFDQTPRSPDGIQVSRDFHHGNDATEDGRGQQSVAPVGQTGDDGAHDQRPQSGKAHDVVPDHGPARGAMSPDANIQTLLASQQRAQNQQGQDKNSEFLLNLLQTKGGSRPQPHQPPLDQNFPLWLEQPPQAPETHAPKPRATYPPGFFEENLLRNTSQDHQRRDTAPMTANETLQRQPAPQPPPNMPPGMPPNYYEERSAFLQQQRQPPGPRQTFPDVPPPWHLEHAARRVGGHPHLPPMQMPAGMKPGFPGPPADFVHSPAGPAAPGPPPGFHPHMARHPPGLHSMPGASMFPPPLPHLLPHARGEPPGFAHMGAPSNGVLSVPGVPPGFFGGPSVPGMPAHGYAPMRGPGDGGPGGALGPRGGGAGRGFDGGYDAGLGPRR